MPNISTKIRNQLNLAPFDVITEKEIYDSENLKSDEYSHPIFFEKFYNFVPEGHQIGKPEPLFKRIMEADVKIWKEKFGGVQEKKPEDAKKDKKGGKKGEKKEKVSKEKKTDAKKEAINDAQPNQTENQIRNAEVKPIE